MSKKRVKPPPLALFHYIPAHLISYILGFLGESFNYLKFLGMDVDNVESIVKTYTEFTLLSERRQYQYIKQHFTYDDYNGTFNVLAMAGIADEQKWIVPKHNYTIKSVIQEDWGESLDGVDLREFFKPRFDFIRYRIPEDSVKTLENVYIKYILGETQIRKKLTQTLDWVTHLEIHDMAIIWTDTHWSSLFRVVLNGTKRLKKVRLYVDTALEMADLISFTHEFSHLDLLYIHIIKKGCFVTNKPCIFKANAPQTIKIELDKEHRESVKLFRSFLRVHIFKYRFYGEKEWWTNLQHLNKP